SQTVEGRERYTINVRYFRDERSDPASLKRVLVTSPGGAQIPLAQLADIGFSTSPPSIRREDGPLVGYVFVDLAGRDLGSHVAAAACGRGRTSRRRSSRAPSSAFGPR